MEVLWISVVLNVGREPWTNISVRLFGLIYANCGNKPMHNFIICRNSPNLLEPVLIVNFNRFFKRSSVPCLHVSGDVVVTDEKKPQIAPSVFRGT